MHSWQVLVGEPTTSLPTRCLSHMCSAERVLKKANAYHLATVCELLPSFSRCAVFDDWHIYIYTYIYIISELGIAERGHRPRRLFGTQMGRADELGERAVPAPNTGWHTLGRHAHRTSKRRLAARRASRERSSCQARGGSQPAFSEAGGGGWGWGDVSSKGGGCSV